LNSIIKFNNYINYFKLSTYINIFIILTIYYFGLQISEDYGISWDENVRRIGAKSHAKEFVQNFGIDHKILEKIPSVEKNLHAWTGPYGMIFEFPALLGELIIGSNNTKDVFLFRHKLIFTFHFLGILTFFLFSNEIFGSFKKAIFSTFIYAAHPRIFAHSFFNPKDIIFLSLVVISLFPIIKYFNTRNIRWLFYSSIMLGLAMSCRIVGIYLPFLLALFYLFIELPDKISQNGKISYLFLISFSIILASFFIMYIATPYYWFSPIDKFIETFEIAKNFPWLNNVFFFGKNMPAPNLPWYYIVVFFFMTTPILYIIFFIIGVLLLIKKIKKRQNPIFLFSFFGIIVPVIASILFKSTVYDGWRHFYFTYVFISILISYGVFGFYNYFSPRSNQIVTAIFIFFFFVNPIFTIIQMHPYQQVYFNALAGKDPMLSFEGDYYGSSYKLGLEYILKTDAADKIFLSVENNPGTLNRHILSPKEKERLVFNFMPEWQNKPDYFITNFRNNLIGYIRAKNGLNPYEKEIFSVMSGDMKILGVYKL